MNKFLKILTLSTGIVFLALLINVIRMLFIAELPRENNQPTSERAFHYAFFMPPIDHTFLDEFKAGAIEASEAMNCAITFHPITDDLLSFEMASYTGINGIAAFIYEKNDKVVSILNHLSNAGIPVIQIENEIAVDPNTFFIGTNSYESGKGIGRIALESEKNSLNIVLIYSEKNPGLLAEASLLEMGMNSILGDRLNNLYISKTNLNPIDAEQVVYELLQKSPAIDLIVLTDIKDTLVTIQAIIDLNLVGKIKIIGFDENDTIREYIDKGIVLGSIVRHPYRIGYSAVMALKEISTIGYTSAYVDTGINILTRKTLIGEHKNK
ncbi:MAG TPA: substrate-binding domain-containing protein [Spirochaetia bacterium]|nr:substrate-binding domain-containing protein [Spirochaetia bacterium]